MMKQFASIWKIKIAFPKAYIGYAVEWAIIITAAFFYSGGFLLDFDSGMLQQTGEHNESAALPILIDISLHKYGEIPLWNPYMLTGFPHAGDLLGHFWHPLSTLPIALWGAINGMKMSIVLAFMAAGLGQWMLGRVLGLRRVTRMWSALLFMFSGGLGLLWKIGWYELLLGMAWFPWSFAALIHALKDQTLKSIALAALAITMILTTGGGYYPLYLAICLIVLTLANMALSKSVDRFPQFRTAVLIAALSAGLSAVALLPYIDGLAYTMKQAGADIGQKASQPIVYALMNYVIAEPEWFRTEILGTAGGYNWFYIGWLPLAALIIAPLAGTRSKRLRNPILATTILFAMLIVWHANQYTFVKNIYDAIPFLYNFRFPGRLLIVATPPLIALAALALEYLLRWSLAAGRLLAVSIGTTAGKILRIPFRFAIMLLWIIFLFYNLHNVFQINQGFTFAEQPREEKPAEAMRWLKHHDDSLYYINIGGGSIYWFWAPAAFEMELPVINFYYGRKLKSMDAQYSAGANFHAAPKYIISTPDQPRPESATAIREFDGIFIYEDTEALPFAFAAPQTILDGFDPVTRQVIRPLDHVRYDGPNRVEVIASSDNADDILVALVSDYPGWSLTIDGKAEALTPINGYLGANMINGKHTYVFSFFPAQYALGLAISVLALIAAAMMIFVHPRRTIS